MASSVSIPVSGNVASGTTQSDSLSITTSSSKTILRAINLTCIGLAIASGVAGAMSVINIIPTSIITAVYAMMLSLVLLLEELGLFQSFVVRNFGFMMSCYGKGMFLIFLGALMTGLGFTGLVVGLIVLVVGVLIIFAYRVRADVRLHLDAETIKIRHEAFKSDEAEYVDQSVATQVALAALSVKESAASTKV